MPFQNGEGVGAGIENQGLVPIASAIVHAISAQGHGPCPKIDFYQRLCIRVI
jgi:hypothetical protein